MRITTWNINSIRAHLNRCLEWHDQNQPDVLCLQELKCEDWQFPAETFEDLGYFVDVHGQKAWNGVGFVSLDPLEQVATGVPHDDDGSRGITGLLDGVRIVNLYVVNGKAVGDPKYARKLAWLDALYQWLDTTCTPDQDIVICGDFNIAPDDRDVWNPAAWKDRILCSRPERDRFERLLDWGLSDAYRLLHDQGGQYTWWDMRTRGILRNEGLRIDHFLVSKSIAERVEAVEVDDQQPRRSHPKEKPSDHAPVTLVLRD